MATKTKPESKRIGADRPMPPKVLLETPESLFLPAADLITWAISTFINPDGPLTNEDHAHLIGASLVGLWTSAPAKSKQRRIVGQAEMPAPRGNPWAKERELFQLRSWFGDLPDFLFTFDANYAAECSNAEFCALLEHQLYHAGQAFDQYGQPKFHRDGTPFYAIREHDVTEFIGVTRRYGPNVSAGVPALVAAAAQKPAIARARIDGVCGTCAAPARS